MNPVRYPRLIIVSALALSIAACGGTETAPLPPERDPMVAQALSDQLMVDPDLVGQNQASSAITIETDYSLPTYDPSGASIRQARSEAAILAGGEQKMVAPELSQGPDEGDDGNPETPRFSLAENLAEIAGNTDCSKKLLFSAEWAARMPDLLPVYPQGATQLAAGFDGGDCHARAVTFLSAAAVDEVAAFYAARAKQAGFPPVYRSRGTGRVLSGRRNTAQFRVQLRELPSGLTEVDLVTLGF